MTKSSMPFSTVQECLHDLQMGKPIILMDNEDRENEGDLVMASQFVTPEWINFMAKEARGLICTPITKERAEYLNIPPMVNVNQSGHETAFTVSIDVKIGTTTGISSSDRAKTILHLCSENAKAQDFARPGHIFPLIAKPFGVLEREGHTEASIDLCKMANLYPCAVICEIMNLDGTMSRLPEISELAKKWNLKVLTIQAIKKELIRRSQLLKEISSCNLPTRYGNLQLHYLENVSSKKQVLILSHPTIQSSVVRVHSSCMTSEVFGSLKCDCSDQLQHAMDYIAKNGGHIIYLDQEGRGIGLANKIKAYQLQDEENLDTIEANVKLGHPIDARTYENAYYAIKWLGLSSIELMTNNPLKIEELQSLGIAVNSWAIPATNISSHNENYLRSKIEKLQHHNLGKIH
jgi:3,4-dihydroxy 2-butanone 4-phosphate synthase/GTP cyclohydrolase II